jgi:hypothetical protein
MEQLSFRTDAELWRLAETDPEAFGELFERHARAVHAFCARRKADLGTAEDLTSIVFLEAWRRRGSLELSGESALPWLLAIANNVARNSQRSRRRYRAVLSRLPLAPPIRPPRTRWPHGLRSVRSPPLCGRSTGCRRRSETLSSSCSGAGSRTRMPPVRSRFRLTVRSRLARARRRLQLSLAIPITSTRQEFS